MVGFTLTWSSVWKKYSIHRKYSDKCPNCRLTCELNIVKWRYDLIWRFTVCLEEEAQYGKKRWNKEEVWRGRSYHHTCIWCHVLMLLKRIFEYVSSRHILSHLSRDVVISQMTESFDYQWAVIVYALTQQVQLLKVVKWLLSAKTRNCDSHILLFHIILLMQKQAWRITSNRNHCYLCPTVQ